MCAMHDDRGYTLVETMVALMFIGILAAMAMFQIAGVQQGLRGDGAMRVVMSELNAARETAIAQRQYVEITFVGSDSLRVTRHEDPGGVSIRNLAGHRQWGRQRRPGQAARGK